MSFHGTIKSAYLSFKRSLSENPLSDYLWLAEQEVNSWTYWVDLPPRRRLWLWRHGFTSPDGALYDFETHGPDAYLSERQRYQLYRAANGRHRYLLDDKLSQHWMLADYPAHRPAAYGVVDRGLVHGLAGTEFEGGPVPVAEWLPPALREHSRLVCKQLRGSGGKQVLVAEHDDGEFRLDGESTSEAALCREVEGLSGYLVSEHVDQHAYADALYPNATNTIRLLTVWDDEAEELLVPVAVHRIGTDDSRPVDNLSAGGLSAEIDLETGELGRAAQLPFSGRVPWYATHPDTAAAIEGTAVPHWERVRSTVERIARDNTTIPIVGWDILLDEAGEPVVIEANTGTDIQLMQVHRPLLADPRVRAVVSRHLPEVDPPAGRPGREVEAVTPDVPARSPSRERGLETEP